MTRRRPDNRDERHMPSPRLDEPSAVRGEGMPATTNAEQPITGVVGDASVTSGQSRSGEDTRRRGWFWHWNSIVTQFSPIIGLKGVGLLNSYTVWTDRREDSRHRGYAFPSQQSEADFYGEDRNELITINKILVALDLIEIRKEMVPRTDERGRRWKVPHNLYRVKDHGDEFNLSTADVMRVVELADRDRAVYRYVRRIFSAKFAPIDRDNIWHRILEELRPTDVWQRLAARTERDETRASARSRAGHASRRTTESGADFSLPSNGDTGAFNSTVAASSKDSNTDITHDSLETTRTSVAGDNNGSGITAAQTNNGLEQKTASTDAQANTAPPTNVAPTSTTYYQDLTTTTTRGSDEKSPRRSSMEKADRERNGPGRLPDESRSEEVTVRLFEEANARESTPAARRHLKRLAEECADLAQAAGVSGWELVGQAIEEAVSSGSAFVAPKRVKEIIARWSRDGVPEMYAPSAQAGDGSAKIGSQAVTSTGDGSHSFVRTATLPNDRDPVDVWDATCQALAGSVPAEVLTALRERVSIVGYDTGEIQLGTSDPSIAESLMGDWQDLIQPKLGLALRRPVRITVHVTPPDGPDGPDPEPEPAAAPGAAKAVASPKRKPREKRVAPVIAPPPASRPVPVFMVRECGMSSSQVWTSVLDDLRGSGSIPRAEVDTWLRDSLLIGRDEESDAFIVGVPHALAERRAVRFLSTLEQATMHIVGFDCEIRIVRTQAWLAAQDDATGTDG